MQYTIDDDKLSYMLENKPYISLIISYLRPSMLKLLEKNKKNLVGAEIGVKFGQNASHILKGLDIKTLYLVDPYPTYEEDGKIINPENKRQGKLEPKLKNFKDKIVWIRKLSVEAAKDIEDNSLDFVYIDANHDYEFVRDDIKVWTPKVKIGGMVAGHDIERESVLKAVKEYGVKYPSVNPISTTDSDWWFWRKEEK